MAPKAAEATQNSEFQTGISYFAYPRSVAVPRVQ